MSTTYTVTLDLRTVGSLNMGLGPGGAGGRGGNGNPRQQQQHWTSIKDSAIAAERAFRGATMLGASARAMIAPLDAVAGAVFNMAKWGGAAAGAGLFAGMTYGVTVLNSEVEKATMSLASLFKTHGFNTSIPGGMDSARDQIAKMRVDARELPGEFEDLQRTFLNGANVAFRAGANPDQWRKTAAMANAVGLGEFQMERHMLSREVAQLLEGRSGSHNVFGVRLAGLVGDRAKEFNQKTGAERLQFLNEELNKRSESLQFYKLTFDAASNTLKDHLKLFGTAATMPLFNSIKKTLFEINDWIGNNEVRIAAWANYVGTHAEAAFEFGKQKLLEWGPAIGSFATNLYNEFDKLKTSLTPLFESISAFLKTALGGNVNMSWAETLADPKAAANLAEYAKWYAGIKGMQLAGSAALNVGQAGAGLFNMYAGARALGLFGGIGGGAAAAGGAAATGGLGAGLATGGAGALAGALAMGLFAPAALIGGMSYAAFGGGSYKGMRSQSLSEWQDTNQLDGDQRAAAWLKQNGVDSRTNFQADLHRQQYLRDKDMFGASDKERREAAEELSLLKDRLAAFSEKQNLVSETAAYLRANFQDTAARSLELAWAFNDAAYAAGMFSKTATDWEKRTLGSSMGAPSELDHNLDVSHWMPKIEHNMPQEGSATKTPKHPGGAGGTTVQKVEIVVSTNQNASRVAQLTKNEIAKLYKHPRISPYAPPGSR